MHEIGGPRSSDAVLIIRDDEGVAYAVPRGDMEQFRMTPSRHAHVSAQLQAQAAAEGVAIDALGGPPVYEVDATDLAPYRLSKEEWTRLDAALHGHGSDVHGFESGRQVPSWVAVVPSGDSGLSSHVHTYPAWYWLAGDGG